MSGVAAGEETDEPAGRRHDHQSGSADEMIGDVLDIDDGEEFGRYGFRLKEFWQFTGPAWMVSIAYLDPGNLETDLQAGAQFGYTLSWVLLWSSVLGLVIQILALRLGIVTRRHLAEHCRDEYPGWLRYILWFLSEIMIIASDVPEVIGTAFAIQILSHNTIGATIPLWGGVLLCGCSTMLFLALSNLGLSYLTTFVGMLVGVMSACFMAECVLSPPDLTASMIGSIVPKLPPHSQEIAVGLLGSVVMPHNLFLQSGLVLNKDIRRERTSIRYACRYTSLETAVALLASFLINMSVLLVAASSFAPYWCAPTEQVCPNTQGASCADAPTGSCFAVGLETAAKIFEKRVGANASSLWAVALLASGQSSTVTGTFAGQYVMQGFIHLSLPMWARNLVSRLVAILPALYVSRAFGAKGANDLIVFSSVVLSLHLPLALVPLLKLTDSPLKMGNCANHRHWSALSWGLTAAVVGANALLVWTSSIAPLVDALQTDAEAQAAQFKLAVWCPAIILYLFLVGYLTLTPMQRRCPLPPSVYVGDRTALAFAQEVSEPLLPSAETPAMFHD